MLETLLESRAHSQRSAGGAIASVAAHTAIIAAAVYATAQARVPTRDSPATVARFFFAPIPTPRPLPRSGSFSTSSGGRHSPVFVVPNVAVDVALPSIDMSNLVSAPGDFRSNAVVGDSRGDSGSAPLGSVALRADQVAKQAALVAGSASPRYPELLRSSGIGGQVVALFVVNEQGRAEESSIRFLRSDNQLFEEAVRDALPRMRFIPAEAGGKKVRQLVQMPFVFTLAR